MTLWQRIKQAFKKPAPVPTERENKHGEPVVSAPVRSEPDAQLPGKKPVTPGDKWVCPLVSRYVADPDMGGLFATAGNVPKGIVIHHTVSYDLAGTIEWFKKEAVDIHFLVDRDGQIVQMVPCNRKAAHAGKSSWAGFNGLNDWFLGIELINIGPLKKEGGKFFDFYGREWKGRVRERFVEGFRYWEPASEDAEEAIMRLCVWLCEHYDIPVANVVGHFEASPGRKNDPAGAFSFPTMHEFRRDLQERLASRELMMAFV